MIVKDVAVGFLYHVASGKVLLHLRGADAPPSAGKWAFFLRTGHALSIGPATWHKPYWF